MKSPKIRYGLIREVMVMAFDTVRSNKLRSGLTVLGVVIGITSIVAMTALIRGFDTSLQDSIRTTMGPNTIFIQRFGVTSFASGREFSELIKRPTLTSGDARALEEQATTLELVDLQLGLGPGQNVQRRMSYGAQKTRSMIVFGTGERYAEGTHIPIEAGRFFTGAEVQRKATSLCSETPCTSCSSRSGASTRSGRRFAWAPIDSSWSACSANAPHRANSL